MKKEKNYLKYRNFLANDTDMLAKRNNESRLGLQKYENLVSK